jgi:hypothetical protein
LKDGNAKFVFQLMDWDMVNALKAKRWCLIHNFCFCVQLSKDDELGIAVLHYPDIITDGEYNIKIQNSPKCSDATGKRCVF